jgi:hypothetical protein
MMHSGEYPEAPGTKVNNTVAQSGIKIGPGRGRRAPGARVS